MKEAGQPMIMQAAMAKYYSSEVHTDIDSYIWLEIFTSTTVDWYVLYLYVGRSVEAAVLYSTVCYGGKDCCPLRS